MRPGRTGALGLSLRLLTRQGRSGALLILVLGLAVASAALNAVGLFIDRVGHALERQAGEVLAADLVVTDRQRLPRDYLAQAHALGLETAEMALLSTVLFIGEESHLIDLKAVTGSYPLRGQVGLSRSVGEDEQQSVDSGPTRGRGWMAERGLRLFDVNTPSEVSIGRQAITIERVLTWEPDRGGSRFLLAPRLIVHLDDLLASELLGPGARVSWRLLVAGERKAVERFERWVEPRLNGRQALETVVEADAETGAALDRARQFLGVAALTTILLAAVAILLSAGRFARSQRDTVALLKAFGAGNALIMGALAGMMLWLVLGAVALGSAVGYATQQLIAEILAAGPAGELPPPRWLPLAAGGGFTILLAIGFALPPLIALRTVAPMRILNRSLGQQRRPGRLVWLLPIAVALAIPVIQLGELRLAWIVLGSSLVLALVLALAAWWLMLAGRGLARSARAEWRFGLAALHRRQATGIVQITALGLGLMVLLLLMVVRGELMDQWRNSLPADSADHFVVNIQPDQAAVVEHELREAGAENLQVRPMATANLIEVNGQAPPDHRWAGQVNLSWIDRLPPGNRVREGRFFEPAARAEVSLAQRWSDRTGLGLGDQLVFESGAHRIKAVVTSIRQVEWTSFNVNFFILLTPEDGQNLPHQLIASFRLADEDMDLRPLQRRWPNLSIIDIGALIDRIRDIIARVSAATQVVFVFTLLAGLIVLLAALEATRDERRHEAALIRALGGDDRVVNRGLLIEYGAIAVLAATLASVGAALTGWLLARQLFEFSYRPSLWLFLVGFAVSVLLVVGSGWLGNRSVLRAPAMRILRGTRAD